MRLVQAPGPVFLTVRAQYEAELTAADRAARTEGFAVERRYESAGGEPMEGRPIPAGSLVRVRLRVRAAAKQNYVAVEDKLPAGLEPLNANLETTESVSLGPATGGAQRGAAVLSHSEIRDARVSFYADEMAPGDYEFAYVARATTRGRFLRPAASAEETAFGS